MGISKYLKTAAIIFALPTLDLITDKLCNKFSLDNIATAVLLMLSPNIYIMYFNRKITYNKTKY